MNNLRSIIKRRSFLKAVPLSALNPLSIRPIAASTDSCGAHDADYLFPKQARIKLAGLAAREAGQFAIDSTGCIYTITRPGNTIRKHDPCGKFIRHFGAHGRADGQFILPMSVCLDAHDNVYVLDVSLGRIQVFNQEGLCQHRISLVGKGIQASLVRLDALGNIYLGGVAQPDASALISKINLNGDILTSFYPPDRQIQKLNLWVIGDVKLALDVKGDIYAGQQVSAKITKFAPSGAEILKFGELPPCYRAPVQLPQPYPADRTVLDGIIARFTRLDNLLILQKNCLGLCYRSPGSPGWLLQLYASDAKRIAQPVKLDLRPAATDQKNSLYCRRMPTPGQETAGTADLELVVYTAADELRSRI